MRLPLRISTHTALSGILCAGVLLAAAWTLRAYTPDDAFISFSYAQRHAAGDGWVASAGTPPVEGFSNPLWVFLLEGAARANFDLSTTAKLLGIACGALLAWLTAVLGEAVRGRGDAGGWGGAWFLATWAPLAVWAASGMENTFYGCCLVAGTLGLTRELWGARRGAWSVSWWIAAVWTRPEAFGLAAVAAVWRLTGWRTNRRATLTWCLALVLGITMLGGWRYATFGEWLPNTYFAKRNNLLLGNGPAYLARGAWQAGYGALAVCACVPVLVRLRRRDARWHHPAMLLGTLAGAQAVFVLVVGGDWMHQFRFLTPLAPFVAVLGACGLADLAGWVRLRHTVSARAAVALVVGAWVGSWPAAWRSAQTRRSVDIMSATWAPYRSTLHGMASALGPGASIVIPELGYPSYATDLRVLDPLGLASAHVAHLRYERVDRLLRDVWRPEAIKVHSLVREALHLDTNRWFRDGYALITGPDDWATRPQAVDGWYVRRALYERDPAGLPPARAVFGQSLELRDAHFESSTVRAGETVRLHVAWVPVAPCGHWRYVLWIRTPDGQATRLTRPALHGWRAMSTWLPGQGIADRIDIALDDTVSPGRYDVALQLEGVADGEVVPLQTDTRQASPRLPSVVIGEFEVVTRPVSAPPDTARAHDANHRAGGSSPLRDAVPTWSQVRDAQRVFQAAPFNHKAERVGRALWRARVEAERAARRAGAARWRGAYIFGADGATSSPERLHIAADGSHVTLTPGLPVDQIAELRLRASSAPGVDPRGRMMQWSLFDAAGHRVASVPLPSSGAVLVSCTRVDDELVVRVQEEGRDPNRYVLGSLTPNPWGAPFYPPEVPVLLALAVLDVTANGETGVARITNGRVEVRAVEDRVAGDAPPLEAGWEIDRAPDVTAYRPYEVVPPAVD